jgi:hypothetical protein
VFSTNAVVKSRDTVCSVLRVSASVEGHCGGRFPNGFGMILVSF